ncbi:MAG: flagellar basal body rod protein FlgB [Bacillota bacterium]
MKDIGAIMQGALDGAWARQEILANNVANAETPGYKRLDLDFRGQLQKALGAVATPSITDPRHLSASDNVRLFTEQDLSSITPDGNSVDIDKEMGEVSTNALYYAAVSKQLSSYLGLLRKAITEGRR